MNAPPAAEAPSAPRSPTLFALLFIALAVAWLWRAQLAGEVVHFGNHDRLQFGLTNELVHYDHARATHRWAAWHDGVFLGVNHGALPSVGSNLSPLKMFMPWVERSHLYFVAGLFPPAFMLAAALTAFLALRSVASPAASAIGAVVYATSTFAQLNFAQMDMAALLLITLPLGTWLLVARPPDARAFPALFATCLPVTYLGFAPQAAYVLGFWIALAFARGATDGEWRPLRRLALAYGLALVACLPRLLAVLRGLGDLARTVPVDGAATGSDYAAFTRLQEFFNVRPRELWRFLDDGLFGRFPAEAARLGNNLNLNEGFQVYATTFGALLALTVLLRHRGRWLGVFHPRVGWLAVAAWTLVGVTLIVFFPPVTYLVHRLFFSAPILHARVVVIALLPLAALIAVGIDAWLHQPGAKRRATAWGAIVGTLLTVGVAWAFTPASASPPRLAWSPDPRVFTADVFAALRADPTAPLPAPHALDVRRPAPRQLHLTWRSLAPAAAEFEIEMARGDGEFASIGRSRAWHYDVGDTATDDRYTFRVRTWLDGVASGSSPPATVAAHTLSPGVAPSSAAGSVALQAQRVIRLLVCVVLFSVLLILRRLPWAGPSLRRGAAAGFAVLIVAQALADAEFRAHGPHTRSFPRPFQGDNFFNTPRETLRPPDLPQLADLHAQIEPDRWRTAFVTPPEFFGFATPHLVSFWRLRTVEGYLSGVSARLAALPWPADTLGLRTLAFRRLEDIPWPLLAVLNVREVVVTDAALYFNHPRSHPLERHANPYPVLPRVFFAAHTRAVAPFDPAGPRPVALPGDPAHESWVESPDTAGSWSTTGEITADFAGDTITLALTPAEEPRFLVLNEMPHPGWRARGGDGRELPIHATNTVMRGLIVPAGETRVELSFAAAPTRTSVLLAALLALGGVGGVLVRLRARQKF